MAPLIQLRKCQQASFRHPAGILGRVWRRQLGKSYGLGAEAIDVMLETAGITCVFMSAALKLGQENLRKEAEVWRDLIKKLKAQGQHITTSADNDRGDMLDVDAVADMLDASKLEVKLWHDNVTYSRSIVIAANPDTAVGFTGWLFLDEVGRMPNFRDVWEAAEPFAASNPQFKIRLATTPPPDDAHHSYEILAPPVELDFPVNAEGNFYRSAAGILIHRVDAYDAAAGGIPIYDSETRLPLTPEEAREKAWDKTAWDRNFGCKFLRNTGQAAIVGGDLDHAQHRGKNEGKAVAIFDTLPPAGHALEAMIRSVLPADWARRLTGGPIGMGLDPATSDGKKSNPSAITVSEKLGIDIVQRLVIAFKSADPDITKQILDIIISDIERVNKRPKGLSIDGSNEIFFARSIRTALAGRVRCTILKGGENIEYRGDLAPSKIILGNLYANAYSEGRMLSPAAEWLKEDHRLVRRVSGSFEAAVLPDGRHADTFDSGKHSLWVLEGSDTGPVEASAVSISEKQHRPGLLNQYAHLHERRGGRLHF
jgi:hypothetical protein